MGIFYRPATQKRIAAFLLTLTITELGLPSVGYALTSGPSQPEFSSFEPVSTNQLVDEFSGDFTYNIPVINIPGPQGSDYPLSLSYHSGATSEEEASWVGYGWTLNPGAITRNTRGFPDDFNKAPVTYYNKMPTNWTVTAGAGVGGLEVFGKDFKLGADYALRYNNYQGFGSSKNAGIKLGGGVVSLGFNQTDGRSSMSASINPVAILNPIYTKINKNTPEHKPAKFMTQSVSLLGGNHALFTYGDINRSTHAASYTGGSINLSVGLQIDAFPVPAGVTTNVFGSYSWQTNKEQETLNAYGYLYSAAAGGSSQLGNDNDIRDYYTEKETAYNKRDNFLGMPFNNADVFMASGEGVGGSFRLYHDKAGEFVPNYRSNRIAIANLAPELSIGTAFGFGTDFGAGWQELSEGPWENNSTDRLKFADATTGQDHVFFRFANDMGGGTTTAAVPDQPVAAGINPRDWGHPNKGEIRAQLDQSTRPSANSRASFIGYHTLNDLFTPANSPKLAKHFSQRKDLPVDYSSLQDPGAICEMAITTANGGRYLYGLPVLSRQEYNLEYNIVKGDDVQRNYLAAARSSVEARAMKIGEGRPNAYASSFPVTEIQTADYVDRTLNGPTADDFGGYTRFNYVKKYGGTNWYNWRSPYNGLLFKANSLSDAADDLGAVSYGQKEVVFLQSVQTKTHTAIFKLTPRDDGRDALPEDSYVDVPNQRTGAENPEVSKGYKGMWKLSRIDLYNNNDLVDPQSDSPTPKENAVPIKSVHFSYSYELFQATQPIQATEPSSYGLPNALIGADDKRQGKLTLTRVWFEYQGIPTKVSPYSFSYNYPDYATYPAKYYDRNGIKPIVVSAEDLKQNKPTEYYNRVTRAAQNPVYDPLSLDAWGNYCANGPQRAENMQPWLDQRDLDDLSQAERDKWDPGAWQLKGITLPTGGEIHVQYEQDDYAYVQNRPVHAMAPLLTKGSVGRSINGVLHPDDADTFQLDTDALGLLSAEEKQATVDALNIQYKGTGRKIFFKFLYNLAGTKTPILQPLTTNGEYITGYTTLEKASLEDGKVQLKLDSPPDGYTLPQQVCRDFLLTQRAGKLGGNKFTANQSAPMQAVRDLIGWYRIGLGLGSQCGSLNPALSYFRIPLVKPKKGGGLRVKRLLTFDKTGLDETPVLYGSEYSYRMRGANGQIISSGVATTEPTAMREENILVDYLPRQAQSLVSKAVSGLDRKQAEGPLGESLLPAPSVGYSRVVVRNIHSGRTSPGFSISEYATARDYPMQVKYTPLQSESRFHLIPALLYTDQLNNTYAAQGYSFLLNNMHGQIRSRATYPGNYPGHEVDSNKLPAPTTEQKYYYYEPASLPDEGGAIRPGDYLPVVGEQGRKAESLYPGREVDMTTAQKAVKDNMVDINFETDGTLALFFWPLFYHTVVPSITRSQAELYTHVTTKVIRYPAVVKRIETKQDGIRHITENVAFDQLSGQVVQTHETDEFKGGYVHETTQAAWVRPELGTKWDRENWSFPASAGTMQLTTGSDGTSWLRFSGSACDGLAKLTRGDQLRIVLPNDVEEGNNTLYFADAPDFLNKQVRVYPIKLPFVATASAVPPGTGVVTSVQILTSGRRNQLTSSAASTVYHGTDYTALSSIGPFTTSTKYETSTKYDQSTFSSAISSWLGKSTKTTDTFSSSTTSYAHINLSAYTNKLPVGCVKDPSDVTISNVILKKQILNGKITVSLISCLVSCDDGTSTFPLHN